MPYDGQIAESSGPDKLDLILGAIMNLLFFFFY